MLSGWCTELAQHFLTGTIEAMRLRQATMEFSKDVSGSTTTLKIRGELDATTTPDIRSVLDEIAAQSPERVIVDLSSLRLIDSSGVGGIVSLFKRVRANGGNFEVLGVCGQPKSIFKVLRLDRVFDISA